MTATATTITQQSSTVALPAEVVTNLSSTLRGVADLLDGLTAAQPVAAPATVPVAPVIIQQQPAAVAKAKPGRSATERCPEHKIFMTAEGECHRCAVEPEVVVESQPTAAGIAALFIAPGDGLVEPVNAPKAQRRSRAARNASRTQRVAAVEAAPKVRATRVEMAVGTNGHLLSSQPSQVAVDLLEAFGLQASTATTFESVIDRLGAFNKHQRSVGEPTLAIQAVNGQGVQYSKAVSQKLAGR